MTTEPGNALWDFSLRVYRQPGVAEACLRLQDRDGADVNLVLCFCWLASWRDKPLEVAEVEAIIHETADWRDGVVRPLRAVRRRMKEAFHAVPSILSEPLRSEIKRAELESERVQQTVLFERVAGAPVTAIAADLAAGNAMANIDCYFNSIGARPGENRRIDCETVIAAAFPSA